MQQFHRVVGHWLFATLLEVGFVAPTALLPVPLTPVAALALQRVLYFVAQLLLMSKILGREFAPELQTHSVVVAGQVVGAAVVNVVFEQPGI